MILKSFDFNDIYDVSKHQKQFPIPKRKRRQLGLTDVKKATQDSKRKIIYDRGNGICYLCGNKVLFSKMSIDHVIPKSRGGSNNIENLRPTHKKCNLKKGNKIL